MIFLGFIVIVLSVGILLNPSFWQSFRDAKFMDEMYKDIEEDLDG